MPGLVTDAVGPKQGPLLWRDRPGIVIGVIEEPPPGRLVGFPIGIALPAGWDEVGRALYRLTVRGQELSGRWIVVDRRFVLTER